MLEDWLGAVTASSPYCGSCGDNECRTVSVSDQIYEAIPAALIVRAGLLAAADVLRNGPQLASEALLAHKDEGDQS